MSLMDELSKYDPSTATPYTHILEKHPHKDPNCAGSILFRADTGIRVAQRVANTVVFGDHPNRNQSRVFMNPEFAEKFIQYSLPLLDMTIGVCEGSGRSDMKGDPNVEVRNMERIIELPNGVMDHLPAGITGFGHKA